MSTALCPLHFLLGAELKFLQEFTENPFEETLVHSFLLTFLFHLHQI